MDSKKHNDSLNDNQDRSVEQKHKETIKEAWV